MTAYFRPETLDEALQLLARSPITLAAGCTDLFPARDGPALGGSVLDLTGISGLRGIARDDAGWRIGATTTWADLLAADLPPAFDMLRQAAREVGSCQIQNAGTLAGNLCNASPAADGVPPLLALDARVEIATAAGRRQVPLGDFLTGVRRTALPPGGIVTAILVPETAARGRSRFLKLGARKYLVISIAMVAVRLVVDRGSVAAAAVSVGACGPVATRLPALEAALQGCGLAELGGRVRRDLISPALSPIDDIRADAAYRIDAACELLARALADLVEERL